jgi:thymidylate synthase
MMPSNTANIEWLKLLMSLRFAQKVSPRGEPTREIISHHTRINMKQPIVTVKARKLGYKFMAAEAAFILSGDDKVENIAPYSREISKYSDDGVKFFGAYGPKVLAQLDYVVDCLWSDQNSRQAVMTIWRENPPATKDVPCTVSIQWLIRHDKLYCIDTMRSSDAWLGWPYDVFNFSMLSGVIILKLKALGLELELGDLHLTAGSQHLYERNIEAAVNILEHLTIDHFPYGETYHDFNPLLFASADDLVKALWVAAGGGGALKLFQDMRP